MTNKKFLEFNGRNIYFLAKDGVYWIAVRPICEALSVDFIRQFKNLKADRILGQLLSEQTIVAADGKLRKMTCLPEKFIYGWIFTIQSASPDLLAYKWKCYEILYDHFQGAITAREETLKVKTQDELELEKLEATMADNNDYNKIQELRGKIRKHNKKLTRIDSEIISGQLDIWKQEFEMSSLEE